MQTMDNTLDYDDQHDIHFDDHHEEHKIVSKDDPEVYSLILPPGRCTKRFLNASDVFLSLVVISPLVIIHWRGTWALMDENMEYFPPLNCFVFGMIFHLVIAMLREFLYSEYKKTKVQKRTWKRVMCRTILTKVYAYLFSWACQMHWRGGWAVIDEHIGVGWEQGTFEMGFCLFGLLCFKSLRNVLAPPTIILTDTKEFAFGFPTRFRMEGSQDPGLYILDCAFSVLVIGTLVVFVWRGTWVICDLVIYPEDTRMTAWGSLVIGYGVVAVTFSLQSLMRFACDRLKGFWRVAAADIFLFFSFIGTVNVWRGVWQLCDIYFLRDSPVLSNSMTHSAAFLLLALLNCSNSVLVRGVYIDAEEPAGQCVIFPVYYIRLFFQKERTKKQKRLIDALEKLDHINASEGLLPDKACKTTKILPMNNKTDIHQRSIELQAMLSEVENVNEKTQNIEHMILRTAED